MVQSTEPPSIYAPGVDGAGPMAHVGRGQRRRLPKARVLYLAV